MDDFKLKYEMLDGGVKVTEWMTEQKARMWFDQLKKNSKCVWCELLYSPVDYEYISSEDYIDEEQIVDEFMKEVVVVKGLKIVIQKG